MKDLIITFATNFNFDQLKPFILSANEKSKDSEKVILLFNADSETVKKIEENNFSIISPTPKKPDGSFEYTNTKIHMNVERFGHIWANLRNLKNKYRYILALDSRDLIFQKDPFIYIDKILSINKNINFIASSETAIYKDETFFNAPNFYYSYGPSAFDHIKDNFIYNAGTIAGRSESVIDLFSFIFFMSVNNAVPNPDQAAYNFILSLEPFKSMTYFCGSEEGWAAQLGMTLKEHIDKRKEPLPIWKHNKLFTNDGTKQFYILHQYDRIPEIENYYKNKYL